MTRQRRTTALRYYSTPFHELNSQHRVRIPANRTLGANFDNDLYSKEELVTEMGPAFLCAIAGIANKNTERNTTAGRRYRLARILVDRRSLLLRPGW